MAGYPGPGMTCRYVLLVSWISLTLVSALLLFSRGFLMTRTVLKQKSCCSVDSVHLEGIRNSRNLFAPNSNCSQKFCLGVGNTRAIIFVVDALRYDFVVPYSGSEEHYYHNKLTVLDDLVTTKGARLYKFIADPPTTTFQRVNALTTGSLPTFIDIGSNFASTEINEDNIIDKLRSSNRTVVFMGDDTWIGLYPNRFARQYPYPSFNVWDLETVDNGVKSHLVDELQKSDWDVILAHVLGVDHCGHRYGARHPEMARKLSETNDMLREVVENMDNRTVLFVMGDHGMTDSGDHGGESHKEVTAALVVYSKNPFLSSRLSNTPVIQQVDFVPTFSQIMGIPIPFSSLGSTFLTNLPPPSEDYGSNTHDLASLIVWTNVEQVTKYFEEYARTNSQFPSSVVEKLLKNYKSLSEKYKTLNIANFSTFMEDALKYMNDLREVCRAVWVQFDSSSMSRGLVLIFLTISLGFIVVDGLPSELLHDMIKGPFLWYGFLFVTCSSGLCCVLRYFNLISRLELSLYITSCCSSIVALSCLIVLNWYQVAEHWYKLNKSSDPLSLITRVIALVSAVGMFSNSYVVQESSIIPYLLTSLVWVSVIDVKLEVVKKFTEKCSNFSIFDFFLTSVKCKLILLALCLNVILRLTFYFWECREEQNTNCHRVKNMSKTLSCVMTVVSFATFITLARLLLRNLGNLTGWSPPIFISRYFPTVNVVCCGCYWILNSLPTVNRPKLFFSWQIQLLPITVFFISGAAIVLLYVFPLCVHRTYNTVLYHHGNLIPSIFNKMRNIMSSHDHEDRTPVIYGLATVYSATFINLSIFISFLSAVLLGESRAIVNVLMICSMFLLAVILSIVKFEKSKNNKGNCFLVPWWSVLCWALSSSHFFYATGHQPTFSTVQWDCAGLFGNIVSTIIPGALVVLNTFISQITHSLLLPLLMIIPFTVATVWPKVVHNSQDFRNGELELFQNDDLRRQEMFNLLSRYILFSAFKVFVSMFSACIHSRHMMVWAIFAPKFIFEGLSFLVSLPFLLLGFLFVERISTKIGCLVTESSHID
uniref:GPI ethanolamine phosphate transferase 3 n=2 Tax=Lygus hesperus TaxID=30085 RepID=A0A0A9XMR5_LYGHE